MTESARRLMAEIERLPQGDRAELAQYLIRSLESAVDDDAEAAWDEELHRRVAEIQSGADPGDAAANVFAQLRQKYS